MAEVFAGHDTVLDRAVAIKVLRPQFAADPAFADRFLREARATAGLLHPNVVAVFDAGTEDGRHFIVMEQVPGRTLRDLLAERGTLPVRPALAIAAEVAAALEAAHAHGLVHRDVKPANVMVGGDMIKVVDFGIAQSAGSMTEPTSSGPVLGTPLYLAPEQAEGRAPDARGDLYALGVCLYEMLTGRPPFTGPTGLAIAYQHVHEQPTPPRELRPGLPEALEAVVMRAMAKDPDERFQTASQLRAALEGLAVRGRARPSALAGRRSRRRAPVRLAAGLALLVVLALAVPALLTAGRGAVGGQAGTGRAPVAAGLNEAGSPTGTSRAAESSRISLPYLRGLTVAGATGELRRLGLRHAPSLRRRTDPAVPAGLVLGTVPATGTSVLPAAQVTMVVSRGAPPSAGAGTDGPAATAPAPGGGGRGAADPKDEAKPPKDKGKDKGKGKG
jgi:serine/threonine-protein kinase